MAKGRRRRPEPRKKEPQYRINERIRVPQVRLVGENVETDIYPTRKALEIAYNKGLDLVEIAPTAKPPVCKIIDYKKFLYDKKRKEKEIKAKAAKTVVKEIRFGPNTDEHDFEFKAKHADRFLKEGAKVKAYVHFKGRSILFKERGELILLKFAQRLDEVGTLEQFPKLEGKRMFVFLAPKKAVKPKVKTKPPKKKLDAPPKKKWDVQPNLEENADHQLEGNADHQPEIKPNNQPEVKPKPRKKLELKLKKKPEVRKES